MRPKHPIRHCRLWLLALVVIVLAAASSAAALAWASQADELHALPGALLDFERGPAHAH